MSFRNKAWGDAVGLANSGCVAVTLRRDTILRVDRAIKRLLAMASTAKHAGKDNYDISVMKYFLGGAYRAAERMKKRRDPPA